MSPSFKSRLMPLTAGVADLPNLCEIQFIIVLIIIKKTVFLLTLKIILFLFHLATFNSATLSI